MGLQRERVNQLLCFTVAQQHQLFGCAKRPKPLHIQRQSVNATQQDEFVGQPNDVFHTKAPFIRPLSVFYRIFRQNMPQKSRQRFIPCLFFSA